VNGTGLSLQGKILRHETILYYTCSALLDRQNETKIDEKHITRHKTHETKTLRQHYVRTRTRRGQIFGQVGCVNYIMKHTA